MDLIRSSIDDDVPACRICHCTESPSNGPHKLISPCHCSGSLKFVHHNCLQQWLDATNGTKCELCKHPFSMLIKYKPLYKWGSLNASPSKRRRLICNSVFNLVSLICIFWSIYVLVERASLDARDGRIDWTFYVRISVVTIGLIIGVIFLFVQLKLYFSIFMKWRKSNRIIIIMNMKFDNANNNTTTNNNISPNESPTNCGTHKAEGYDDTLAGLHVIQMSSALANSKIQGSAAQKVFNDSSPANYDNGINEFFIIPINDIVDHKSTANTINHTGLTNDVSSNDVNSAILTKDGSHDATSGYLA